MTNLSFPWLALGLGLLVAVGLAVSGAFSPEGTYKLPLLTMLIVNEFGFFVTAIGAGLGINALLKKGANTLLAGVSHCRWFAGGHVPLPGDPDVAGWLHVLAGAIPGP